VKRALLVVVTLLASLLIVPATPAAAIIGGSPADVKQYKYFVTVLLKDGHACGGSLIGGDWVLTAAHCVEGAAASDVSVYLANGKVSGTSLLVRHPLYNKPTEGHDLALILLPTAATSGLTKIQAGAPWDPGVYAAGSQALVMGTGYTTYFGDFDGFRTSYTELRSDGYMDGIYNPSYWFDDWLEPLMIGAGTPGHTVCYGDSGGPLIARPNGTPVEVGVVSFGYPTDCDHAAAFAELAGPQLAWIASVAAPVRTGWGPCPLPAGGTGLTSVYFGLGRPGLQSDGPYHWEIACVPAPPSGRPAIAFTNVADGLLWEATTDGTVRMAANGLGVAPGTSPAIAQLPTGRVIAFQSAGSGNLWIVDANNAGHDTGVKVSPGTNPAIAAHPNGGWEVVFRRDSDGALWATGPGYNMWQPGNGLGIAPGTSPALAALATGGYRVAFAAYGTGNLWTVGPDNAGHDFGVKVAANSSPAIAASPTGATQVAFRREEGALWTLNAANQLWYSGLGIAEGSSPSIAALADGGYEMAFRAYGSGHLWTVLDNVGQDTGQEVKEGTSPAAVPLITGGATVVFAAASAGFIVRPSGPTVEFLVPQHVTTASPSASTYRPVGPVTIVVPSVLGQDQAAATATMTAAGLVLASVDEDHGCLDVPGTVIAQTPSAGAHSLPFGSPFSLTVTTGTDSTGKPCPAPR
jgi:hypothetical protein